MSQIQTNDLHSELKILTYNVRSLIDLKRRSKFANCVSIENGLNNICLTETWLTSDVTDEALFLEDYTNHRRDRKSEPRKTKHGGDLIAVRNIPHERVTLNSENEYVVINVKPKDVSMLICCLYNPPKKSPYIWSSESLISLTNELNQ